MDFLEGDMVVVSGGADDPTGGEELYDLQEDHGEMVNRAADPAHREVLSQHRAMLGRHIRDTGDPFYSYAVVADERWRSHASGYGHHRGPTAPLAFDSRR